MINYWHSRPAAVKLAVKYVGIIMLISLFFSLALYRVSVGQLEGSLRRQSLRYRLFSNTIAPPIFEEELAAGQARLQVQLIYFNLIILAGGSLASYALARQTLRPIEDALEAQSRFTADASHELRTPLTAMQTEIEVALRNPKLSKDQAVALLGSSLEEVGKLRALSDGLLRLARENGKELLTESVSIADITTKAIKSLHSAAKAKQISILADVGDLKVHGDSQSLTELMVILIDNAIKYGDAKSNAKVTATRQGKFARISVTDEGQGIKATDLPYIFDRFYRSDSSRSKDHTPGYGLGLSIAHKIIELHDGSIQVESNPGQGSTFAVKLPLAEL